MGAQMTKELGVYNEEEKISTPLGPQRYRILTLNDPRSATAGIARTPIRVECSTPTGVKIDCQTKNVSKLECNFTEDTCQKEKENAISSKDEVILENLDTTSENNSSDHEPKYLETDIDKIDSPTQTVVDVFKKEEKKEEKPVKFPEFKSPSFGIGHTPVLVECTPELFALHSRIDSLSFCDFDIHSEDPSVIVSDDDQLSVHNQSSVKNWLVGVEDKVCVDPPSNDSFTGSPRQVSKRQKELNAMKKKLFFTPDANLVPKPKIRTPLGDLQAGNTPQKTLQTKQWRNIQEERQRRGLLDTENTPPNLPPLAMVSSAPGKILNRKRSKANWDEDNVLLI